MPLVGCREQPAHRLLRILANALAVEIHAAEMVLGVGIAKIGRRIIKHFVGVDGIGLDVGGDAHEIVPTELHKGVRDEERSCGTRLFIGMGIGKAAEILERALIVPLHSVAFGIHAAKFPGRPNIALASQLLERFQRGFNTPSLPRDERRPQVTTAADERLLGRGSADRRSDIGGAFGAIKGVCRGQAEAEQRNRQKILKYPHSTPSRPRPARMRGGVVAHRLDLLGILIP